MSEETPIRQRDALVDGSRRTGGAVDDDGVRAVHVLEPHERLLGWLYVGGTPDDAKPKRPRMLDLSGHVSVLPPE